MLHSIKIPTLVATKIGKKANHIRNLFNIALYLEIALRARKILHFSFEINIQFEKLAKIHFR